MFLKIFHDWKKMMNYQFQLMPAPSFYIDGEFGWIQCNLTLQKRTKIQNLVLFHHSDSNVSFWFHIICYGSKTRMENFSICFFFLFADCSVIFFTTMLICRCYSEISFRSYVIMNPLCTQMSISVFLSLIRSFAGSFTVESVLLWHDFTLFYWLQYEKTNEKGFHVVPFE